MTLKQVLYCPVPNICSQQEPSNLLGHKLRVSRPYLLCTTYKTRLVTCSNSFQAGTATREQVATCSLDLKESHENDLNCKNNSGHSQQNLANNDNSGYTSICYDISIIIIHTFACYPTIKVNFFDNFHKYICFYEKITMLIN